MRLAIGNLLPASRRGVSLLEVLISIFVLSVGLLGVAALIPVGRYTIVEAGKADRSGACGRAAERTIRAQHLIDYTKWLDADGKRVTELPTFKYYESYCLDPILLSHPDASRNSSTIRRFPGGSLPSNDVPTLRRVTLEASGTGQTLAKMPYEAAKRMFTWRDDLLFDVPQARDLRTRGLFVSNQGASAAFPAISGEPTVGTPLVAESDENYSWFCTVSPGTAEVGSYVRVRGSSGWSSRENHPGMYLVSIVVVYKRDFTALSSSDNKIPLERVFNAQESPKSWREVDLWAPSDSADNPEYMNIVPNTWLLLCGRFSESSTTQVRFTWHKIVSVTKLESTAQKRVRVTLIGPDQPLADFAAIIDGVVGVYYLPVTQDRLPEWMH